MIPQYKADNVYLIGDTHTLNYTDILKFFDLHDFVLIHVGDAGEGFESQNIDEFHINRLSEYCHRRNGQILTVRGNHSNPVFYENAHWSEKYTKVQFVKDYTYININDKLCLFAGGAVSVDRFRRLVDVDYWTNEVFRIHEDVDSLPQCDILITHSAPISCAPHGFSAIEHYLARDSSLKSDLISERNALETLYKQVNPQTIFYGHFHSSISEYIDGTYRRCLDINEIVDATSHFITPTPREI